MKIPENLRHKPVIKVEDYDTVDGRYALHTDAKGLSLGLAQWNDRGKVDISGKVWPIVMKSFMIQKTHSSILLDCKEIG